MADLLVLGAFAFLLLLWPSLLWRPRRVSGVTRASPLLVGHRGVRGARPENTVAAFELAFALGLDGVETDVQRSADGTLVLFHDFELDHAELGRVRVPDLTLAELREQVPAVTTLADLFALARAYPGTLLNLELKAEGWRSSGLERELVRAVRASGLAERVLVSSFNPVCLVRVRLRAPELRVGLLYAPDLPLLLRSGALAAWLHADALHPHESLVDPEGLERARRRGLALNTWTVNEPMRITSLYRSGVNAIIGDDPEVLRRAASGWPKP